MQYFSFDFRALGSQCEIGFHCASGELAATYSQRAIDEIARIERKYSRYLDDSHLAAINKNAGAGWVEVDAETQALLDYADTLYESSSGLFDITSGCLRHVWRFTENTLPAAAAIGQALQQVGWKKLIREGGRIKFNHQRVELDFGGFGKEYAVDRAADVLALQCQVKHGYVNLGGDIRVIGPKPDGSPWQMGIRDPRHTDGLIATLPIHAGGLATSGDYERFIEVDGVRYCHIINPQTGYPARHWRSVSVMAPSAVVAGSISTIAMLKEEAAKEFLDATGFPYLAIDFRGDIFQHA